MCVKWSKATRNCAVLTRLPTILLWNSTHVSLSIYQYEVHYDILIDDNVMGLKFITTKRTNKSNRFEFVYFNLQNKILYSMSHYWNNCVCCFKISSKWWMVFKNKIWKDLTTAFCLHWGDGKHSMNIFLKILVLVLSFFCIIDSYIICFCIHIVKQIIFGEEGGVLCLTSSQQQVHKITRSALPHTHSTKSSCLTLVIKCRQSQFAQLVVQKGLRHLPTRSCHSC